MSINLQRFCAIAAVPAAASLLLLGGAGCKESPTPGKQSAARETKAPEIVVEVLRVTPTPQERSIGATGSLLAYEQATLSTKVAGRLEKNLVDLGDHVARGQTLVQIEPRDYQLRVQQSEALLAQARVRLGLPLSGTNDAIEAEKTSTYRQTRALLDEAKANRDRFSELAGSGIISKSELDTSDAAYQVALSKHQDAVEEIRNRQALVAQRRAELEIARQQLLDTTIVAPFDGSVQERKANLGEYLSASSPVLTLVRMNPLRLRLDVPERDAAIVQIGQKVRVSLEGHTNVYLGEVKRLSPAIDEQTRVLRVEADVENRAGVLRPGAFARAEIVTDRTEMTVTVPRAALIVFAGIEKVWLAEDGKAVEKSVASGRRFRDLVEILQGLKPGDAVILNPPGNLQTGTPVKIAPERQRPKTSSSASELSSVPAEG